MKTQGLAVLVLTALFSSAIAAENVVTKIVKAPITPDGDVAGAPTDLVIDLDKSLDPAVAGRPLAFGCSVRVTLPDAFQKTVLPVQDIFTVGCAPGNFQCTTGIFLQGWPQHPILPHFPIPPLGPATQYGLTLDGSQTLVFTALTDLAAPYTNPAPGPGLKQIHLINGFINPKRPGFYPIKVEFTDGPGCAAETGVGHIHIVPKIRPSIEVTSVFNAGAPNTIYQTTNVSTDTPFPWDFLLWDRTGAPMENVSVEMINPDFALLKQGNRAAGHIRINTPAGAMGHAVSGGPSTAIIGPIKNVPTARLTAKFRAGSAPGRYSIEVTLHGGNTVNMFVDAI